MTNKNISYTLIYSIISILLVFTQPAYSDHGLVYISGGAGSVKVDSSTDESPNFVGSVDERNTTWSLGLGLNISPYFSLEGSYVDFDEFDFDGLYMGTPSIGSVESDGWEILGIGKIPIYRKYDINLLIKIGYLFWDAEEEEIFGGVPEPDDSETGEDFVYGLGIQGKIFKNVDLRAEWTRYEIWDDDVDTITAEILFYPFGYGR